MGKERLGIFEIRKFSVDELLKTKPETLSCLEPIENEPNNFTMDINKVTVHDVRSHKIIYGSSYAIIRFFNKNGILLASLSAFGSSNDKVGFEKPDEYFYVGYGSIISGTSLRVMNGDATV